MEFFLVIPALALFVLLWTTFVLGVKSVGKRMLVLGAPADALLFLLSLLSFPLAYVVGIVALVREARLEFVAEGLIISGIAGLLAGAVLMVLNRLVLNRSRS